MGDIIQIKVHKSLGEVLEELKKEVTREMKKTYGLKEITIHGTIASQILAAKKKGIKNLKFKIKKTGLNSGILDLL